MLFLQKFSYLFILVIISIISSCHLFGNPRFDINWQKITMKEISNDILELQKDLNKAKEDIDKLNIKIGNLEEERDRLKSERDRLTGDNTNKDSRITELNREIAKKDGEINNLNQNKASLDRQINKLKEDVKTITKAKDKALDEIKLKDGQIKNLQKEVEGLKQAKKDLEREKGELEREKSNLEGSNNEKDTQINNLREEIAAKLREIAKKEAEKETLKIEKQEIIDGLNQDLVRIKGEKTNLERDLNSLKEQLRKKDENDGFDNFKNIVEKREREDSYSYKDFKKFKGELKNLSIWRKSLITDYNKNIASNIEAVKNELINGTSYGSTNNMFKKRDILGATIEFYLLNLNILEELIFQYMINRMKESFDFIKNKDNYSRLNNADFYWEVKMNNAAHYAYFYANLSNIINYIYHNKLKGNRDYRKLPYTNLELKEFLSRFTKILVYHFPTIYDFLDFLFEDTDKYFD